jgi:hypothetical protein
LPVPETSVLKPKYKDNLKAKPNNLCQVILSKVLLDEIYSRCNFILPNDAEFLEECYNLLENEEGMWPCLTSGFDSFSSLLEDVVISRLSYPKLCELLNDFSLQQSHDRRILNERFPARETILGRMDSRLVASSPALKSLETRRGLKTEIMFETIFDFDLSEFLSRYDVETGSILVQTTRLRNEVADLNAGLCALMRRANRAGMQLYSEKKAGMWKWADFARCYWKCVVAASLQILLPLIHLRPVLITFQPQGMARSVESIRSLKKAKISVVELLAFVAVREASIDRHRPNKSNPPTLASLFENRRGIFPVSKKASSGYMENTTGAIIEHVQSIIGEDVVCIRLLDTYDNGIIRDSSLITDLTRISAILDTTPEITSYPESRDRIDLLEEIEFDWEAVIWDRTR